MANARWKRERAERDRVAALTAEQYPSRIVRRIIVIDNERDVREVTIWNWESGRDWKRKERKVLTPGPGFDEMPPDAGNRKNNKSMKT